MTGSSCAVGAGAAEAPQAVAASASASRRASVCESAPEASGAPLLRVRPPYRRTSRTPAAAVAPIDAAIAEHLDWIASEVLATSAHLEEPPADAPADEVELDQGAVVVGLRKASS